MVPKWFYEPSGNNFNQLMLLEPFGRISFKLHPPGGHIETSKTGLTGVLTESLQTTPHGM